VKPWFQGKIPFSFNLPDINGSDYTLVGLLLFLRMPARATAVRMITLSESRLKSPGIMRP
jgi:hypothetical protein